MTDYDLMCRELYELSDGIDYDITVLSNASALLFAQLDRLNWAGFYLFREGDLKLGPFQGKPACTVIRLGKGVCGTAAAEDRTVLVPDVHQFPGHIACDSASNSELVIPLHSDGKPVAVLDLDSPVPGRFSEEDEAGLKKAAEIIEKLIVWET
jgi:GAF domain-containing protein